MVPTVFEVSNSLTRVVTAVLLVVACGGCESFIGSATVAGAPYTAPDYDGLAPAEVAVLPPVTFPLVDPELAATTRRVAYEQLLAKGYAPLSLRYVDGEVGSAGTDIDAARQAVDCEAHLVIELLRPETLAHGEKGAVATVELIDRSSGRALFGHRVVEPYHPGEAGWTAATGERLATRLLVGLPARRTP